jgi:hypothetical protein
LFKEILPPHLLPKKKNPFEKNSFLKTKTFRREISFYMLLDLLKETTFSRLKKPPWRNFFLNAS